MEANLAGRPEPQRGMTLMEIAMTLAIAGAMLAGGAFVISRYGRNAASSREAGKLVDNLWDLRSRAARGLRNPCMDFPDAHSVRLYSDAAETPDGFDAADQLLLSYSYSGGVRALSLKGGAGRNHSVCFGPKGVADIRTALLLVLGADSANARKVRLLPSTGTARVL